MPDAKATVRPMLISDLSEVAALHTEALPSGFFVRLGPGFLRRYHECFLASPHGLGYVTDVAGVTGFITGTHQNAAHYRWVARHRIPHLLWAATIALAGRPRLWAPFVTTRLLRYLRGLRRLLRRPTARPHPTVDTHDTDGSPEDVAVLTHVAVAPQWRGHGCGAALVETFTRHCAHAGASEVRLVTRAVDGAGDFYRRQGWIALRERTSSDGRLVVEFRRVQQKESPA